MTETLKYTEIYFHDIKVGDEIKAVYTYDDGSTSERTGKVTRKDHLGNFTSEAGNPIAQTLDVTSWNKVSQRAFYRKAKPYVFPKNPGAVILADITGGTIRDRRFVFNGVVWHCAGINDPRHRSESSLRSDYTNFRTIYEGVSA